MSQILGHFPRLPRPPQLMMSEGGEDMADPIHFAEGELEKFAAKVAQVIQAEITPQLEQQLVTAVEQAVVNAIATHLPKP